MLMQGAARAARPRHARTYVAGVLIVVGLAACGGGGGSSGETSGSQSNSSNSTNANAFAVSRIEPANGATNVVPERLLSIQLSREPNPASVNDDTVEVTGVEGRIPGKITVEGAKILFRPSDALTLSSEYKFTIKPAVKDMRGNALEAETTSVFKIREAALSNAANIDTGATGEPVQVKIVRSATGDAFAVWRSYDGTRHNLWANHYTPATNAWGTATLIETTDVDIISFELGVDTKGGAMVLWRQSGPGTADAVVALRYDTTTQQWPATPKKVNSGSPTKLAVDANGNALAVWNVGAIRGRYYDARLDQWQPATYAEFTSVNGGSSVSPSVVFDAFGNAFVAFGYQRTWLASVAAGNLFTGATRQWDPSLPDLGVVPDSFVKGFNLNFQVGVDKLFNNFFAVWESIEFNPDSGKNKTTLRASRFSKASKTWLPAQDIVEPSPELDVRLRRVATSKNGRALVLWTQTEGGRTALKSALVWADDLHVFTRDTVDADVGGGASEAQVDLTPCGTALAVWLQNEGGRPDDGSRTNVYFNLGRAFPLGQALWGKAMP
ncbi:MAG TPA: Ig-like domain-containing protein, partial [Burkholderiaceae bacterium]|nr:Ig-like domain-containing protein [Burkholderiaceae bacterium]